MACSFVKTLNIANNLLRCQVKVIVKQKFPHCSGTATTIVKGNNIISYIQDLFLPQNV